MAPDSNTSTPAPSTVPAVVPTLEDNKKITDYAQALDQAAYSTAQYAFNLGDLHQEYVKAKAELADTGTMAEDTATKFGVLHATIFKSRDAFKDFGGSVQSVNLFSF